MTSHPQHPESVGEPGAEDEVDVAGLHGLQPRQDEGRHQVRVQAAAAKEGDAAVSEALALHVTGQKETFTCTYTCTCTCAA